MSKIDKQIFLNTHLDYSLKTTFVCQRRVMGGIPPPSRGIMGKNRSTQSKTPDRSERVGHLESNGAPLLGSHSVIF